MLSSESPLLASGGLPAPRHLAVQLGVGGLVDLPHAALADEGSHVVMGEAGAE